MSVISESLPPLIMLFLRILFKELGRRSEISSIDCICCCCCCCMLCWWCTRLAFILFPLPVNAISLSIMQFSLLLLPLLFIANIVLWKFLLLPILLLLISCTGKPDPFHGTAVAVARVDWLVALITALDDKLLAAQSLASVGTDLLTAAAVAVTTLRSALFPNKFIVSPPPRHHGWGWSTPYLWLPVTFACLLQVHRLIYCPDSTSWQSSQIAFLHCVHESCRSSSLFFT